MSFQETQTISISDGTFEGNGGKWTGARRVIRLPGRGFNETVGYLSASEALSQTFASKLSVHELTIKVLNPWKTDCNVLVKVSNSTTEQPSGAELEGSKLYWSQVRMLFLPQTTSTTLSFSISEKAENGQGCIIDEIEMLDQGSLGAQAFSSGIFDLF
jgi:hypothetical protein